MIKHRIPVQAFQGRIISICNAYRAFIGAGSGLIMVNTEDYP